MLPVGKAHADRGRPRRFFAPPRSTTNSADVRRPTGVVRIGAVDVGAERTSLDSSEVPRPTRPVFVRAAAFSALASGIVGCGGKASAPPPKPPERVATSDEGPAWLREPRDDADRALLRSLLDADDDVRKAAVDEWEAARIATWDAVYKLPRDDWPIRPVMPPTDWPAAHDEAPPAGKSAALLWEFESRSRGLARGLIAALRGGDAPTRAAAATSMGAMRLPAGANWVDALSDPAADVRIAAAEALVAQTSFESKYDACLPAMCRLLDDPDWRVRIAAMRGVAAYDQPSSWHDAETKLATRRLVELASDARAEVRKESLRALAAIHPYGHDAELIDLFGRRLEDASPDVAAEAATWFGEELDVGNLKTLPPLVLASLRRLLASPDKQARRNAAFVVWRATHDAAAVVGIFEEQLAESRDLAVVIPLRRLTEAGPDAASAVPAILRVLTVDTFARKYASGTEAIDALYAIGPAAESTLPLLRPMLDDADPAVRAAAARAVPTLDGDASVCDDVLARRLSKEPDVLVRHAIHAARGELGAGGASLLADLVAGLRAPDDVERAGALLGWQSLGRKAAPASSDATAALLAKGGNGWTRDLARVALAPVGCACRGFQSGWPAEPPGWMEERFLALGPLGPEDAAAAPALVAGLDAEWPYPAGRALASIGPAAKDVLPELRKRVAGPPASQRVAAADAALAIGADAAALAVLVDAVETSAAGPKDETEDDPGPKAAWALSRAGDAARSAIPALRKAAAREGYALPTAAVCALARLGDGDRVALLVDRLTGYYRDATPVELVETLAALGPAAAPATSALERLATSWEREIFKQYKLDVSRAAIRALGRIGPAAAPTLPTLRRLRHNALFRAEADEAIRLIEAE
jgi:hypothetical protein